MSSFTAEELAQFKKDFPELADSDSIDELGLGEPIDLGNLPDLTEEELDALLKDPEADLDRVLLDAQTPTKVESNKEGSASKPVSGAANATPSTSQPEQKPTTLPASEAPSATPKPLTISPPTTSTHASKPPVPTPSPKQATKPASTTTQSPAPVPAPAPAPKQAQRQAQAQAPPAAKPATNAVVKSTSPPSQSAKKPASAPLKKAEPQARQPQAKPMAAATSTFTSTSTSTAAAGAKVPPRKTALPSSDISAANHVSAPGNNKNRKPTPPSPKPVADKTTEDKAAEERTLAEMREKVLKSMAERRLAKERQGQAQNRQQSPPVVQKNQQSTPVVQKMQQHPPVAQKKQQYPSVARKTQQHPPVAQKKQQSPPVVQKKQQSLNVAHKRSAEIENTPDRPAKRTAYTASGGLTIKGAAGAQARTQMPASPGRRTIDFMQKHLIDAASDPSMVSSRGRGIKSVAPTVAPNNPISPTGDTINRLAPPQKKNGLSIAGRAAKSNLHQVQAPSPIQKRSTTNTVSISDRLGKNNQHHQHQQQQNRKHQNRPWQRRPQRQGAH